MKISNPFILWILLASSTLTVMAGAIIAPVLNLMREGLGLADPASAAIIITTHGIFIALCSPLIGILIDRLGVKWPYVLGLFLYGLAGASGLFIESYWLMLLGRVFLGVAVAAIFTSVTVTILNLYRGTERDKVMGWRGTSVSIGGLVWPILGGFLGTFSWHLPFAVYLAGIPIGILALFALSGLFPKPDLETYEEIQEGSVLVVFKKFPVIFIIYGLMFFSNIFLYAIVVFIPPLLETMEITDTFYIGLYIGISPITAGLTSLNFGKIKEQLSSKTILLLAMAFYTLGFSTISQVSNTWIIGLSIAFYGIGQGLLFPSIMVWIGESVPGSFRGRITSYLGTFGYIGQFLSPILFRPLVLSSGLNSVFLAAGATSALLFLLFITLMKNKPTTKTVTGQ